MITILPPAWLPVTKRLDSALLLRHLAQHPDQVGGSLDQMRGGEDIGEVAAQAFKVAEEEPMN